MSDSTIHPHKQHQENRRLCDFCGESVAVLYCRADSAKLCLSCDLKVHSTNQLFTKHTRSLLCDSCDSSPASIFCSTDTSVLCQNCDWERHKSSRHDRRPLEGFTGCPSLTELLAVFGFEDVDKKTLFGGDGNYGWVGGVSDLLVWDTPTIVSLDDLIVPNDSKHSFQVMGVPPLPKNRNAACGQHKDEVLRQLGEMTNLELNFLDDQGGVDPLLGFESLVPEQNLQLGDTCVAFEQIEDPTLIPSYEASAFQCCSDATEVAYQGHPSILSGSYTDTKRLVPNKDSDVGDTSSHAKVVHEGRFYHAVINESMQVFPQAAAREIGSIDRDTAISRYKAKRKTRRYDKHIRYESRKVRAESRTRIKGRFVKMDH